MQFSKAAEYGLLGLTHLARTESFSASVSEIARTENLSLYFLRNVFQKLRDAGLVRSSRGSGYALARPPEKISLQDVLEAVERRLEIHACLQKKSAGCARAAKCKIVLHLAVIQKRLLSDLAKIKISDLI
ncbi:MAG: Rrf2 family transcriptional regulator [Patescibacteria group bacterium]